MYSCSSDEERASGPGDLSNLCRRPAKERQPNLGHVGLQGLQREVVQQGFQYPETLLVMHPARHQLLKDAQHTLQTTSPLNVRPFISFTFQPCTFISQDAQLTATLLKDNFTQSF